MTSDVRLPAHAGFETYSVLTRIPPPHRASPQRVLAFLEETFDRDWVTMPAGSVVDILRELAEHGVTGGATYDGLIGATARSAGLRLYTCDRRALPIYARLGVEVELVG